MFLLLLGIGFVAGLVTAVSPCVLPVLPILLAGGASGGRRKPFAIVAGLVVSFSVFTLFAAWVLDQLGLPKDLLRNIAIAMLFVIAISLIVPQIGVLIERPSSGSHAHRPATSAADSCSASASGSCSCPAPGRCSPRSRCRRRRSTSAGGRCC